jgi:putative heme utilization carrier protein HutX
MQAIAELREKISANPGVVFEDAAREHNVPPRTIVEALPDAMRRLAPGTAFIDAMDDISGWGDVTVIVHTEDGIMEFGGPVPKGQVARGYFNLMGRIGFHGHLRHERCAGIALAALHGAHVLPADFSQYGRRDHVQDFRRSRRER